MAHLNEALRINPAFADAHGKIAHTLARQGKIRESVSRYYAALSLSPNSHEALNNLAWLLATNEDPQIRNGGEAVRLAERACALTQNQKTIYLGTLAAAYAEVGRYDDAITTAERACASATAAGEKELAETNRRLLELYRAGQPYREPMKR